MRYRSALLLVLFGGVAVAQETSVDVFLDVEHGAQAGVLISLQREVEQAVSPSGLNVHWHSMDASQYTQVYEHMAMLHLRGECRVDAPRPRKNTKNGRQPEALGQTQVVEGKVLPIAEIRCDAVRRLIDREMNATVPDQRGEMLGRALGRVIAHELYHILLRSIDHGREGLARPAQSSTDLVAEENRFGQPEERKLSESLTYESNGFADSGR
jgi:hypothetical protein